MSTRLAHPKCLPHTPFLDEVVDAFFDSQIRASRTTIGSAGNAFLKATPRIPRLADRILTETERGSYHFPGPVDETNQYAGGGSKFGEEMPTCTPSRLGGLTSMLVGGRKMFASHSHDLANGRQAGQPL